MVATCTTDLEIINAAMRNLGGKQSISVTDKTNAAEEMQAAYKMVRDNLIRSYDWNCCIKRGTAAFVEESKEIFYQDYKYIYQVPSDCLGIISVNDRFTGYSGIELTENYNPFFKIRGNKIYTRYKPPLILEYKYRNQDVASYDACFCKVLALDLAMALCQRIKQSESAYDSLRRQREEALGDALRCNALEIPACPKPTGNWLRARIIDEWGVE